MNVNLWVGELNMTVLSGTETICYSSPAFCWTFCQQGSEFQSFPNHQASAQEENNDQVGNTRVVCVGVLPWQWHIYKGMYVYLWSVSALPAIFLPHENMNTLVIFWRLYMNVLVWHVLTAARQKKSPLWDSAHGIEFLKKLGSFMLWAIPLKSCPLVSVYTNDTFCEARLSSGGLAQHCRASYT